MSPELVSKIAIWRAKSLDGRLTEDDMKEAILALRQDRVGAQIASDKSRRAKAKVEIPSADDLLKEMGAM
jgi:hypothetical protein